MVSHALGALALMVAEVRWQRKAESSLGVMLPRDFKINKARGGKKLRTLKKFVTWISEFFEGKIRN